MAIKVTRTMLQGAYAWEAVGGDDPSARKIDATLFNRREGYEVVPMIQKVADHFDYGSEDDVRRVEEVIHDELPGNVRGRKNVYEWLVSRLGAGVPAAQEDLQEDWNERWPLCLAGLDELLDRLEAPRTEDAVEDIDLFGKLREFLVDCTLKMDDLLQDREPPDSQPGEYKYGAVLPLLDYDEKLSPLAKALRWLRLPKSPITEEQWEADKRILDSTGRVTSDGSLVAHSDLAIADYCWVISLLKYVLLKIGIDRRHPFVKASAPIPLSDSPSSLTLAMAGDWGSGPWKDPGRPYPAETVLAQMLATKPDFMVHLGDVYYAGTPKKGLIDRNEEGRYFTKLWKPGPRGALALNSNHEMYPGATGYFGTALTNHLFTAQQGTSY